MREFFVDEVAGTTFTLFGPLHISLILFVVIGLGLIYRYRHQIYHLNDRTKKIIKYGLVIVLYLNMLIYYNGFAYYGIYTWKNHLPIHFCYIASFSFMIACLLRKRSWYHVIYFLAFIGPVPAIIWPKMVSSFDSFIFYQWIISHHVFLLGSFFLYYAYDFHIQKKDLWKVLIIANIVLLFATGFNMIFKTNYIFSSEIPAHVFELYPFLKYFNYPLLILEITGMVMVLIAYIPVYLKQREDKKQGEIV